MKRVKGYLISNGWAVQASLALAVVVFSFGQLHAQTVGQDFFTNSQLSQERTAADGTDDKPGFNPCGTSGVVAADGLSCSAGTNGLLSAGSGGGTLSTSDNVTTFIFLGPGAVTDNMFGIVSGTALGANGCLDGTAGCIGTDDVPTTRCAPGESEPNADVNSLNGLNCGQVRFDPKNQQQTIPNDGTFLTSPLSTSIPMDFNSGAPDTTTDESTVHNSQIENAFVFNPTSSSVTIPIDTSKMPTIAGVPPSQQSCAAVAAGTQATVCGQQSMIEVTGLNASQDSSVSLITSFANGESIGVTGQPPLATITSATIAGSPVANPVIAWSLEIKQDDVAGTGGVFEQNISGSFVYNELPPGANPALQNIFSDFQSLLPTGRSFTEGNTSPLVPGP